MSTRYAIHSVSSVKLEPDSSEGTYWITLEVEDEMGGRHSVTLFTDGLGQQIAILDQIQGCSKDEEEAPK